MTEDVVFILFNPSEDVPKFPGPNPMNVTPTPISDIYIQVNR